LINESCFTMINMGNDGDITDAVICFCVFHF
jgi:hypothetical protein